MAPSAAPVFSLLLALTPLASPQAPPVVGSDTAGVVVGQVTSADGPVRGAEVRVEGGSGPSTTTDGAGRYRLRLPAGSYELEVRSLGYASVRRRVRVASGATERVDVRLDRAAVPLDPVVVTGTMRATSVSASPVKVELVPGRVLERGASSSLMESIGRVNGLYQQVDCAVCYTNSIRINGMEGPYTAVLIDGMPIMGALASVYGLNGISPSLIEQLEILKGPQSTLYGTEAMGGVVNVITRDPRLAPRVSVNASRTSLGETTADFGFSADGEAAGGLLSGTVHHGDRFVDGNGDGFSDVPLLTRLSLFGKGELRRDGRAALSVAGKVYHEERFGGVEAWTEADRGSGEVYGEFVRTERAELMARGRIPGTSLRADVSLASHDQASWYGDQRYLAEQRIGYAQLLWERPAGRHDWLVGLALRARSYDDDTPATATAERRLTPGVFVQDEWRLGTDWTLLGGLRADHHVDHGVVTSPRLSVRWQPLDATVVRVNAGTGFRVVNLFTEDHAALTGSRRVVIEEALDPERSRSLALNVNQVIEFGPNPMMIDVDVFRTRFGNRIRPDYDTDPDLIVYRNLRGRSVSQGLAVSLNQNFLDLPLRYSGGLTLQEVYTEDDVGREREPFAPAYQGVWSVAYTFGRRVTVDWSGTAIGPMRLPAYPAPFERPTRSEPYAVHDLEVRLDPVAGVSVYGAVKNLTGFTQPTPLIAPEDPFGEAFDTNYVWGPIVGRQLAFGARLALGR